MSNFTKRVKRALTYTVAGTTIAWSVGVMGVSIALGAAMPGDLIKLKCVGVAGPTDSCRSVYYLASNGKRYVFPDEKTYKTWYANFSTVKEIAKTEWESYLIGGNVNYRPGTKMLKVTTDPRVYVVAKGGVLWHVATEAVATALYGSMWNKEINDLPDAFFANYSVAVETDGVTPKKVNSASEFDRVAQQASSPDISTDKGLSGTVTVPTGPVGSTLTLALASDTPASGIVVQNAIRVPFTIVNFTASSDGDATIDQVVVERGGGAAQDGAFAGILLWDADTDSRLSNTSKTLNTDHQAVFNEDIVVKAGTTRRIIIAGNMAAALTNYAGEVPTLGIRSIVMKGSTVQVGAGLPLFGNYQTLNNTVVIGSLTVTTGSDNPSDSTQKIGTTDFIFTGLRVTAGSAEDVNVTRIVFNQGGTAGDVDVTNLDLVIDGVVVATVAKATSKDAAFDLRANPIVLTKGKSKQVNLRGDIVSGSARTIRWDIKKQDDVIAIGKTFGFSPTPTFNNSSEPYHNQGATITISRGTVAVSSTAGTTNSNIAEDTKEVTLGKFDFDVRGESLSFESVGIQFHLATSTAGARISDITSVKLVDSAGKVLGGPVDPTSDHIGEDTATDEYGTATITDNFILPPGVHTITVKGDLNADFGANDTIRARIHPTAMTVKGQDTGETLVAADKTPAGVQTSAIYTVKTAAMAVSVSNTPVAQNVVGGSQDWVFAEFRLDAADSGEDIKITQMKSELFTVTQAPNGFTNWRIMDGSTTLQTSSSPDPTGASAGGATTTFVFVNPLILTKGTVKTIKVIANVSSAAPPGSIRVGLPTPHATGSQFSATGKDSGQSATVTLSVGDGQTMTLQSGGTLTIAALTQNYQAGLMPANTSGLEAGIFRMTSVRETIKVEKIYLSATSTRNLTTGNTKSAFNQIRAIHLYDGGTRLTPEGGVQPTTTNVSGRVTVLIDVTSNPIMVTTAAAKDILVKIDTNAVSRYPQASTGDPGQGFTLTVNAALDVTAKGAQSGTTLAASAITLSGATLNDWAVMHTVPTVTVNGDLGSDKLVPGKLTSGSNKDLYKFRVAADSAGDVYLFQVGFLVSQQRATLTNPKIYVDGSQQIAATTTAAQTMTVTNSRKDDVFLLWFTSDGNAPAAGNLTVSPYRVIAGQSKVFTLKGDVACWADGGCGGTSGFGVLELSFLGDAAFPGGASNATSTYPDSALLLYTGNQDNKNHLIWSDASIMGAVGVASGTATTSEQWFNGYRVKSGASATSRLNATSTDVTFNYP